MDSTIRKTLAMPNPVQELRSFVSDLMGRGTSRSEIRQLLESARRSAIQEKRLDDEETLLDALDMIEGWCGPQI